MRLRFIIFLISIILSLFIGLATPITDIRTLFPYVGFYFLLIALFLWICLIGIRYRNRFTLSVFKTHAAGILLSIAMMTVIFSISPPRYKVLADEADLMGVSMDLYQNHRAALPIEGYQRDFGSPVYHETVGKRPLLFPTLVYFVHALRGYSPQNGFVVNFIAGVCLLFILYLMIYQIFSRYYALIAILMMASLPIFSFWTTSGGFETVNLLFILLFFFFALNVLTDFKMIDVELLFLTFVLLSQCRYESVIFVLTIVCLIPYGLKNKKALRFSFISWAAPILFIPVIWQPRLYAGLPIINTVGAKLEQVKNFYQAFGFSNLIHNSSKNIFVFLGLDPNYGFSIVIAVLCVFGIYIFARRRIMRLQNDAHELNYLFFLMGLNCFALWCVVFSFYLGDLTKSSQNRFAMSFLPVLIFAAVYMLSRIPALSKKHVKYYVAVLAVFHLIYFLPYGAAQYLSNSLSLPQEYQKTLAAIDDLYGSNKDLLLIVDRPNLYLVQGYSAILFHYAETHVKEMSRMGREYDHVLVIEKSTEGQIVSPLKSLPNRLKMVPIKKFKILPDSFITIYSTNL